MARSCSVCTTLSALELKHLNRDLKAGIPLTSLARQYPEVHVASIQRHRWNHLDKPVVRDVRITPTEYVSDQIGALADSVVAVRAARNAAVRRDQGHLVLSAARTEQQLTRYLLEELGVGSVQLADFYRFSGQFGRAVYRVLKGRPDFAEALAAQFPDDPELASDLRAQAAKTEEETAA